MNNINIVNVTGRNTNDEFVIPVRKHVDTKTTETLLLRVIIISRKYEIFGSTLFFSFFLLHLQDADWILWATVPRHSGRQ